MRVRFATTNAPESKKRGLLKDRLARARRLSQWAILQRIDFRAIQEGGTYAETVDEETPLRKVLWARFNSFVNGRQIGNGLDVNRRRWRSRLLDDITIGKGDGAVHLAVVEATERRPRRGRVPWKQKVYVVHKPTRVAENSALRGVVDAALVEHTRRDDLMGMPWTVLGDGNGPFDLPNGVELADHLVDSIIGSHHFEPLGQKVVDRPLLSDHRFLIADALATP